MFDNTITVAFELFIWNVMWFVFVIYTVVNVSVIFVFASEKGNQALPHPKVNRLVGKIYRVLEKYSNNVELYLNISFRLCN